MKAFRGLRERLQESWQQAAERERAERIMKASENIIRLAGVEMSQKVPSYTLAQEIGAMAVGELVFHPRHPKYLDIMTDPKLFDGGRYDGAHEAEIIPLPVEGRLSSDLETDNPEGKLIVDPRLAHRVKPPHKGPPPNGPNHRMAA